MDRRELYSVADTPFRGLRSDAHPLALKPGEAFDAKNLRAEPGHALRVRDGIAQELDTAGLPANAVFWGASPMVKVQDGLWLIYLAAEDPADQKVHVYNRQYTTASGWGAQWYELTETSGPFGDTRLSRPLEGLVLFTPVDSDEGARSHLTYLGTTDSLGPAVVVQNGVDRPLRAVGFPNASVTDLRAAPIVPLDPPTNARSAVAEAGVNDALPVRSGAVTTAATAGGTFTAATGGHVQQTGAAGSHQWEWQAGATVTPGDTGDVVMDAASMSLLGGEGPRSVPQIGLVVESSDDSWWDCVKVWANVSYNGGAYAWELLHDPGATASSAKNNRVHVPTNVDGTIVCAYAFGKRDTGTFLTVAMNGLRIEVASDKLTPSSTFKVSWVYASGWIPGTAQYAVSRTAAMSEAESGSVLVGSGSFGLDTTGLRDKWASFNDPLTLDRSNARFLHPALRGGSLPPEFVFPIDPRLFYKYRVPVLNPTQSELEGTFCDTWSVYRKDPGEAEFCLVRRVEIAEWSGSAWSLSLNANEGELFYWTDTVPPEGKTTRRRAPDAFTEVTPIGSCAVYANKRHYVGAPLLDASGTNTVANAVKISEEGYPGRFRSVVRFDSSGEQDASSGFEARLGLEEVRALVAVDGPTTTAGVSSVLCLTDRSLYAIDRVLGGTRLLNVRRVAPFGTQSKHAAVDADGSLIWLDQSRALRSSERGLPDLSRGWVQDRLDEVSDLARVQAALHKGRIYVSRAVEQGQKNSRVLVYSLHSAMWESDDELPAEKEAAQFVLWEIEGASRLLYFAPDCACYEYAKPGQTTDDGDAIAFVLESREFHNAMFGPVAAQHVAIVGSVAPTVLTTQRIFSEPAATVTGEIDLDTGGSLVWRYDRLPGGGVPGGEGQSVRFRVSGDFEDPFALIALAAEVKDTDLGGARA
jgi:hypothetical protein